MAIVIFFISHWLLCVFFQSFFQHRYAAHRMYSMGPRTEKVMHLLTYLVQGSSYLSPRAYAILHREHHAYSDTENDPHSPHYFKDAARMMWHTKERYTGILTRRIQPEPRFDGGYPEWKLVDETLGQSWVAVLGWVAVYTAFYVTFATSPWQFLLLPVHFVMGPVHGAIVNWCGHKYGYRNFNGSDKSRNTLPVDVLCMGELFQNNHHKYGSSPNFAARAFEIDPTWQVMRVLSKLGVIRITTPQRAVYPEPREVARQSGAGAQVA
ncbi:acyl-CoA desaturase [Corallococcus aberystwythensis]|uniref:Acyl-CoA desaturase n=1 Tax=Corallococcus aberystwythensis TaxID=2316722 RepID=A0A3A8QQA4_9BACT|nr:acyl-CoA desaturase [Corallococcus aberystwythensis]RKH70853.1 acyl-CoA desaturase [Corallococcus aberystwythensis]